MIKLIGNGLLSIFVFFYAASTYAKMTVGSYNIRTFDSKKSPTDKISLKKIITNMQADFITVEEIVNETSFKSFIKNSFPNYGLYLSKCGGAGKQKIGFLYSKRVFRLKKIYEDNRLSDPDQIIGKFGCGRLRPALVGVFEHLKLKEEFVAVGVHLKAGGSKNNYFKRAKQYNIISRIVEELKLADYTNILLMGDFNSTGFLLQDLDYINFQNMLSQADLATSSKNLECTSYWAGRNRQDKVEEPSVLDHILFPGQIFGKKLKKVSLHSHCLKSSCQRVSDSELGNSYKNVSDHCPVTVSFE